jgi:hypothetical protein
MTCREFEDTMDGVFGIADEAQIRQAITCDDWQLLPPSTYSDHLAVCSDCAQSLLQFFRIRNAVDYHSFPCFHLAYYSADVPERCIEKTLGLFSIITNREKGEGVVIGRCPWCGIELPVGVNPEQIRRSGK